MNTNFYLEQGGRFNKIVILMTFIGGLFLVGLFYSLIYSTQNYWAF